MLSSQEQRVWDDVQRFWAMEAEEPPGLAPSARSREWVWHDPEDLPVVVAAGVWLAIALVLFGAVLAGLAVLAASAVGWAVWKNWPRMVRLAALPGGQSRDGGERYADRSSGPLPPGQHVDSGEGRRGT